MATRNFVPRADNEGSLGTSSKKWSDIRATAATITNITATNATITTPTMSTASISGVGKTATFIASSDLTETGQSLVDATGFSFSIGANETWAVEYHLKVGSSSAAGTEYGINIPASATVYGTIFGNSSSATAFKTDTITTNNTASVAFNTGGITTAAACAIIRISATIINSTNAGTVVLRHLKVTSGTSTIYAGSYMVARRVS